MTARPILTFEEMTSVDSLDELVALYQQRGISFQREQQFLSTLASDWSAEKDRIKKDAKKKVLPNRLPSLHVTINGRTYGIYGVRHSPFLFWNELPPAYRAIVSTTIGARQPWVYEQNFASTFDIKDGIEVADHSVLPSIHKLPFLGGFLAPFLAPLLGLSAIYLWFTSKKPTSENIHTNDMSTLNIPLEMALEFREHPPFVSVALQERKGRAYDPLIEGRSAYQAEFMRAYKPHENMNILVGRGHAAQIKHFLKRGVKDKRIIDLASQHAELLMTDPVRYQQFHQRENRKRACIDTGLFFLGATPWLVPLVTYPFWS